MTAPATGDRGAVKYVHQGEHAVSGDPGVMLTCVLGSCVSTCLYDETAARGGMNHILLPDGAGTDQRSSLYGVNLMELLINALMRAGADRRRLRAKLFGGARVIDGSFNIGERNVEFARSFLKAEGIPVVSESVGGPSGRRIRFWPTTGRAQQNMLVQLKEIEAAPRRPAPPPPPTVDIELF